MSKVLILPGDGIGKEIVEQALKVIDFLNEFTLKDSLNNPNLKKYKIEIIANTKDEKIKKTIKYFFIYFR